MDETDETHLACLLTRLTHVKTLDLVFEWSEARHVLVTLKDLLEDYRTAEANTLQRRHLLA